MPVRSHISLRTKSNASCEVRCQRRNEKGALAICLFLGVLLAIFMICSMGVDFSHLVSLRAQLRNAADAAALGGAADLSTNPDNCNQDARK